MDIVKIVHRIIVPEGSHLMKKVLRFLLIPVLAAGVLMAVTPALASHESNPTAVTCDPITGSVTVTIDVFGLGPGNSTFQMIYVDGSPASSIDFGYGIPHGIYTQSVVVPQAAHLGAKVMVTDGDHSVSTTCHGYDAAPVPAGFVMHFITCNSPVYDAPAGSPVGANAVTNGQTWFTNPTPVTAGGKSWTEIFVAGLTDGFIPTSCVGVQTS